VYDAIRIPLTEGKRLWMPLLMVAYNKYLHLAMLLPLCLGCMQLEETDVNPLGCIQSKCSVIRARTYEEAAALSNQLVKPDEPWFFCRGVFKSSTNTFEPFQEFTGKDQTTQAVLKQRTQINCTPYNSTTIILLCCLQTMQSLSCKALNMIQMRVLQTVRMRVEGAGSNAWKNVGGVVSVTVFLTVWESQQDQSVQELRRVQDVQHLLPMGAHPLQQWMVAWCCWIHWCLGQHMGAHGCSGQRLELLRCQGWI
jgi:hypothetical protein